MGIYSRDWYRQGRDLRQPSVPEDDRQIIRDRVIEQAHQQDEETLRLWRRKHGIRSEEEITAEREYEPDPEQIAAHQAERARYAQALRKRQARVRAITLTAFAIVGSLAGLAALYFTQ